jgi:hypothetical protein
MSIAIFISCGQFTEPEKRLGREIAELARMLTGSEVFLADEVQSLQGLDANILNALRECSVFIAVMHPRGEIVRPDGTKVIRASVWIEQEIAIATYIERLEKRQIEIIAFKHKSVSLEGIRSLLQLNPVEFNDDAQVLETLKKRLEIVGIKTSGVQLQFRTRPGRPQDGHQIETLEISLVNDTDQRLEKYTFDIFIPASLLLHQSTRYLSEVKPSGMDGYRCLEFTEEQGPIQPRRSLAPVTFDYCSKCGLNAGDFTGIMSKIIGRLWVEGRPSFSVEKNLQELAIEEAKRK